MEAGAQMQRFVRQYRRATVVERHFSKHFVAGKNGHVAKAVTQPHSKGRHDLVHTLGAGTEAIAIGFVAAQVGHEVEIASPNGSISEKIANKFAVAKLRAGKNALVQPIVVIVTKLERLQGLSSAALPVVKLCADAHAPVRVFEEATKIGQAHGL